MEHNSIPCELENAAKVLEMIKERGGTPLLGDDYVARTLHIPKIDAQAALDYLVRVGIMRQYQGSYVTNKTANRRPDPHLETVANFFSPSAVN